MTQKYIKKCLYALHTHNLRRCREGKFYPTMVVSSSSGLRILVTRQQNLPSSTPSFLNLFYSMFLPSSSFSPNFNYFFSYINNQLKHLTSQAIVKVLQLCFIVLKAKDMEHESNVATITIVNIIATFYSVKAPV